MRIAILGYGSQGRAAYEYWNTPENELTICDADTTLTLPSEARLQLGADYLHDLGRFELLVRTPSLHPKDIVAANGGNSSILERVTSVTNEFLRVCPSKNVIGVTGTKGKGTTSTLITEMLEANSNMVHLGGNIDIPPLTMLKNDIQADDWIVLELANFQLIDIKHSPHIAVCLMVVPEHLDWHTDVEEYYTAKSQMFRWQTALDIAVYYGQNPVSQKIAGSGFAQKIPYMQPPGAEIIGNNVVIEGQVVCSVDDIKLLGKHNWQNVCAATTVAWQITQNTDTVRAVLSSFTGLEHRLEPVRELNGVKYYDDSFGTTPNTAIVALKAFTEPKVIILGGSDKVADFNELAKVVKNANVRTVVTIGLTAPFISAALKNVGFTSIVEGGATMESIVHAAQSQAQSGDIVLLSTACASFGLFKNYKDRGDQFKSAVQQLA